MVSQENWKILTPLQKLPRNVGDMGKLIAAKGFKKLPKVQKIAKSGHTAPHIRSDASETSVYTFFRFPSHVEALSSLVVSLPSLPPSISSFLSSSLLIVNLLRDRIQVSMWAKQNAVFPFFCIVSCLNVLFVFS